MAIPKIKHPEYRHFAHGINREIRFRPFTNAEQKILLLAKDEAKDNPERLTESVEQILRNCVLDQDVNIEDLCMYDVEEIFIRIRAKSVGEIVTPRFSYNYTNEQGQEKTDFVKVNVNLDDVKLKVPEGQNDTFMISEKDGVGIKLRHPRFGDMKGGGSKDDIEVLKSCMVCAFDPDEVYDAGQMTDDEKEDLVSALPIKTMKEISDYFENMPKIEYRTEIELPKINEKEEVVFKGIRDFFM